MVEILYSTPPELCRVHFKLFFNPDSRALRFKRAERTIAQRLVLPFVIKASLHTLFSSHKNHVYKNVEAQITLKFKNVVVIYLSFSEAQIEIKRSYKKKSVVQDHRRRLHRASMPMR